jgi:DNA-directed RNA polymerase beta subunit
MSSNKNLANLSLNLPLVSANRASRKYFTDFMEVMEMPNLIEVQLTSYRWFLEKGLKELFEEINSIKDFTGKNLELFFADHYLDKPKYDEKTAKERRTTYEAPLYVSVKLVNKVTGKTKTQDVYLGDFPISTQIRTCGTSRTLWKRIRRKQRTRDLRKFIKGSGQVIWPLSTMPAS